jgi:hypothetical protein
MTHEEITDEQVTQMCQDAVRMQGFLVIGCELEHTDGEVFRMMDESLNYCHWRVIGPSNRDEIIAQAQRVGIAPGHPATEAVARLPHFYRMKPLYQ